MGAVIRARILQRVLGGGPAGLAAAAAFRWGWEKYKEGKRPDVLAVSTLKPGETYTVVTRPAPGRKERKLAKRSAAVHERLEKASRPTRAQKKADRGYRKAERKALRAKAGSSKEARWARRAREMAEEQARLSQPTRRQRALERKAAEVDQRLEAVRTRTITKAQRGTRSTRRRFT